MKKILFLLLIAFLLTEGAHAQDHGIEAEFQIGYGTFSMKEAKKLVNLSMIEVPVPIKVVKDFPPFMVYRGSLSFPLRNDTGHLGFAIGSASTGSRAHYQDYSGEVRIDHLTSTFSMAVTGEKQLFTPPSEKFSLNLTGAIGVFFTGYVIGSYIKVYEEEQRQKQNLASESFFIDPGLKIKYRFLKFLQLGAEVSYLYDTQGKLHDPASRKMYVVNYSNKPLRSNWSGLRADLGLAFLF